MQVNAATIHVDDTSQWGHNRKWAERGAGENDSSDRKVRPRNPPYDSQRVGKSKVILDCVFA